MALRVPKAELPPELSETMIKQFGAVPEPLAVTWHSRKVGEDSLKFGAMVAGWDAADASLKVLRAHGSRGAGWLQLVP